MHGLGRTRFSLFRLGLALKPRYQVINLGYPSRKHSIERLAELAIEPALNLCKNAPKVHFVTHSLGGILVREYLRKHDTVVDDARPENHRKIENLGRTVMLGPPNQGSELVDFFLGTPILSSLYRTLNGPAGTQLGKTRDSKPNTLGSAAFEVGVIAGNQSNNPAFNRIMRGPHDGKVSVESSRLDGMSDHLIMNVDHTFIMQKHSVIKQIQHFLEFGEFHRNN